MYPTINRRQWATTAHVPGHKQMQGGVPHRDPRISIERSLQFPRSMLSRRSSLFLQAVCISTADGRPPKPGPNDPPNQPQRAAPQHRLHWPARSDLVLGIGGQTRLTLRTSKIGVNGRDSPFNVMPYVSSQGVLKIIMSGNGEPGQYLFGVRIAEKRPIEVCAFAIRSS